MNILKEKKVAQVFLKLSTPKDVWLLKCIKGLASENPSAVNLSTSPKNYWNLQKSTFVLLLIILSQIEFKRVFFSQIWDSKTACLWVKACLFLVLLIALQILFLGFSNYRYVLIQSSKFHMTTYCVKTIWNEKTVFTCNLSDLWR